MGVAPPAGKRGFLNYIGFTLLGVLTIICYLVLVRGYYRQKNWIFTRPSVFWKLPCCPWRHQDSGQRRALSNGRQQQKPCILHHTPKVGEHESKKINILLVDDNPKFLASAAERAKIKGFTVFTAENGQAALEIAKDTPIHVAVVDHQMPDMEGLVVITKLKGMMPDIRTILLTGHGDEKLKEATQALNSTYFDKEEMGRFWEFLSNLPLGNINILLVDDNETLSTHWPSGSG
jgi:CheY-like chemotaxis protein